MTALAADATIPHNPAAGRNVYDLVAAATVFAGGLVGITAATGLLQAWANAATDTFVGIAAEGAVEPTVDVAPVHDGGIIIKNIPIASAIQTSVGLQVHCTTDNILTDAVLDAGATSRGVGIIIRFRSAADCDIRLYSHAEFQTRYLQAVT